MSQTLQIMRMGEQIRELKDEKKKLETQISILLSCKKCPENKGGYICEKEYNNKCLSQKIQHIKELQEDKARAKEIIRELIGVIDYLNEDEYGKEDFPVVHKAEAFLKEY